MGKFPLPSPGHGSPLALQAVFHHSMVSVILGSPQDLLLCPGSNGGSTFWLPCHLQHQTKQGPVGTSSPFQECKQPLGPGAGLQSPSVHDIVTRARAHCLRGSQTHTIFTEKGNIPRCKIINYCLDGSSLHSIN